MPTNSCLVVIATWTSHWRHNGRDSDSNHQPHHCLPNRLFWRRSKKTSKLSVTGLCAGNSPVTGEFPAQMASSAENISIWWRHHEGCWPNVCCNSCVASFKCRSFTYTEPRLGHHDDVIWWKHIPRYWPFVWGIHRSPVNSSHKGQWRGGSMFSLICAWTNGWANNGDAGNLRPYRAHYDVIVMSLYPKMS